MVHSLLPFYEKATISSSVVPLSLPCFQICSKYQKMMSDSDNDDRSVAYSGIGYDPALVWSDKAETAYFRQFMNDQKNERAAEGRNIEDSLIGDSTFADMMDEQTLLTFEMPRMKFTGSTGLSLEEDDTIVQMDTEQPRQTSSPAPRQALGRFSKRIITGGIKLTSRYIPKTRSIPLPATNKSTSSMPPGTVQVPGFIFVTDGPSSAVTTTSETASPSSEQPDTPSPLSRRRKRHCMSCGTLCCLALCVMFAGSVMALVFSRRTKEISAISLNGMSNATYFDFPGDVNQEITKHPNATSPKDESSGTQNPTVAPVDLPVANPPLTGAQTTSPTTSPATSPTSTPTVNRYAALLSRIVFFSSLSATSLANQTSPQSLALNWLAQDPNYNTYTDIQVVQRFALSTFFISTSGFQWISPLGWNSEIYECYWEGIECNEKGDVIGISLEANKLEGSLPAEISLLSSLSHLTLDSNQIQGTLPSEIGLLTALGESTHQDAEY
jgi:hypothetical protein